MTIEIKNFRLDQKGARFGRFDVQISSNGKWKKYNNLIFWKNENGKKWITFPSTKINEEWIPLISFDKETELQFFSSCLEALKSYFNQNNRINEEAPIFDSSAFK